MKTYTQHRLTDHMLHRLSQIINERHRNFGVSLQALERRELVETDEDDIYHPTKAGREALDQARREWW